LLKWIKAGNDLPFFFDLKKVRSKNKKIFDRTLFLSAFTLLSKPFFVNPLS